ncbi:MAG: cytochrome P450 [Verrucomicrobia bacterium]|nr:cytochrome P450 [Verrucomicrobiota bacterium]
MEKIRTASFNDTFKFNLFHIIPYFLRGIFTRSRFWSVLFDFIHPDPMAVKFCQTIRAKYQTGYISTYLFKNRSLLVFDYDGIKHVLDNSPFIYADPDLKRMGMSHFQPNALTISRGEEWKDRRRFNESVLDSDRQVHGNADFFHKIILAEIKGLLNQERRYLVWEDFDRLFKRITLRIIFGEAPQTETELTERLERMMRESNRVFLLGKSKDFNEFYRAIRARLTNPEPGSLSARCSHAPSSSVTRVENQVTHWMFAMMETLATNTLRALALIVAHPRVQERVRIQLARYVALSPSDIISLKYLRGCLQEAMRLWPTTAMLVRLMLTDDQIGGVKVPAGTQVIILNSFLHRDSENQPLADRFSPELWSDTETNYHFNHLSNGTQICAGKNLALFIGGAVLAEFLREPRYRLIRPMLNVSKPLPHAFNEFLIKLERIPMY